MNGSRFVLVGLARARTEWFAEVAHWAAQSLLPIEFAKCMGAAEVRARTANVGNVSAALLDAGATGVDRDLIASLAHSGVPAIVIEDERVQRDWFALGAAAVLPRRFGPDLLIQTLQVHALPTTEPRHTATTNPVPQREAHHGTLLTVIGSGGVGTSTVAAALAQALAGRADGSGNVLLADLALNGNQGVLHNARDVVPALQELVESHRLGAPDRTALRSTMVQVDPRGYALLLGLRRPRDWTALAPRSVDATLHSLCSAYRWVVADVTGELDGESETGSADVEERNHLARTAALSANLVLAVGRPGVTGVRSLIRLIDDLLRLGVPAGRLLTVVNQGPRSRLARAELADTVDQLTSGRLTLPVVHLRARNGLEPIHHSVDPLPDLLTKPLHAAVSASLQRAGHAADPAAVPTPIGGVPT